MVFLSVAQFDVEPLNIMMTNLHAYSFVPFGLNLMLLLIYSIIKAATFGFVFSFGFCLWLKFDFIFYTI